MRQRVFRRRVFAGRNGRADFFRAAVFAHFLHPAQFVRLRRSFHALHLVDFRRRSGRRFLVGAGVFSTRRDTKSVSHLRHRRNDCRTFPDSSTFAMDEFAAAFSQRFALVRASDFVGGAFILRRRETAQNTMKTFLLAIVFGCVLGAFGGYVFAATTENLPHYRSQAAFMDGLYRPILAFYGAIAGAFFGFVVGALIAVFRRRN